MKTSIKTWLLVWVVVTGLTRAGSTYANLCAYANSSCTGGNCATSHQMECVGNTLYIRSTLTTVGSNFGANDVSTPSTITQRVIETGALQTVGDNFFYKANLASVTGMTVWSGALKSITTLFLNYTVLSGLQSMIYGPYSVNNGWYGFLQRTSLLGLKTLTIGTGAWKTIGNDSVYAMNLNTLTTWTMSSGSLVNVGNGFMLGTTLNGLTSLYFPTGSLQNVGNFFMQAVSMNSLKSITFASGAMKTLGSNFMYAESLPSLISLTFPVGSLQSVGINFMYGVNFSSLQNLIFPAGSFQGIATGGFMNGITLSSGLTITLPYTTGTVIPLPPTITKPVFFYPFIKSYGDTGRYIATGGSYLTFQNYYQYPGAALITNYLRSYLGNWVIPTITGQSSGNFQIYMKIFSNLTSGDIRNISTLIR